VLGAKAAIGQEIFVGLFQHGMPKAAIPFSARPYRVFRIDREQPGVGLGSQSPHLLRMLALSVMVPQVFVRHIAKSKSVAIGIAVASAVMKCR
jgi:hypothetical protein